MIEIIPAIDLINGQCVRLSKGEFSSKKVYSDDPVSVALRFQAAGLKRLHLVDLDGARKGIPQNLKVLSRIAAATSLTIDYGGGIKKEEDLLAAFDAGASMVNIGSLALKDRLTVLSWAEKYGSSKIIIGADVQQESIVINGWQKQTAINVLDFIGYYHRQGLNQFCCTDIEKDGMLSGTSIPLYKKVLKVFPGIELIASGGVSSMEDIIQLENIGCSGVILGKCLYEHRVTLDELRSTIVN